MIWKFGTWSDGSYKCGQCGRTKKTFDEAKAHETLTSANKDTCIFTMNPISQMVSLNKIIKSHV